MLARVVSQKAKSAKNFRQTLYEILRHCSHYVQNSSAYISVARGLPTQEREREREREITPSDHKPIFGPPLPQNIDDLGVFEK